MDQRIAGRPTHLVFNRRRFLAGASALIAAGFLPKHVLALAGPVSFKQGTANITVVSDGELVLPVGIISPDAPQDQLKALLVAAGVTGTEFRPATNITLIRTGGDLILFDTGSGSEFQPTAGKVLESLAMAQVEPAAITKVIFTHAHPDHVWGTVNKDGKLNFPNASYHVAEAEWNFWMGKDILTQMPKEMHPFVLGAQKHFNGVKDRLTMLKPGDEVAGGIKVLDTSGHTPGHISFEVAGDGGLILVADSIANPVVFFPHPEWHFGFDSIPDVAAKARAKLLDRAAAEKIKLLGYHWPYPGLGFAEKKNGAYQYVAAS